MLFVPAALVGLMSLGPPAAPERVTATAVPEATAIRVDGELNDAVWQNVPPITAFKQREPRDGAEPTQRTEARVAYDATALYVAIRAVDTEPHKIVGIRTRRDAESPSDWVRVIIDSFHDRRTAFEFGVNPAGVKRDVYWYNDTNEDPGWDAVWDVAVTRDEGGWRAEFKIPFSQLRFNPGESETFGLAVVRMIGRLNETDTWPLISKSATGVVSSFGELTGLRLGRAAKRLEVVPYAVAQVKTQPTESGNPFSKGTDPDASLGVDFKYAVRPALTLTGTVNPDFGQVEADPAVVNLSAFETFFSERRPFFLEGSGIFSFDIDCNDGSCSGLFYSRRIGRAPRGSPDLVDGTYATSPVQTTILGAAKLTGRIGGFSIGALTALTSQEDATIANGTLRTKQDIEPFAGYSVLRARREFANQSSLGFMATSTNRHVDTATHFLPGHAHTGGLDWDWRFKPKYSIRGFVAGSTIRGDATAIDSLQRNNVHSFQRPDATSLTYDPARTSMEGYGGNVAINKIGGQRVRFTSVYGVKSPGFEINDVGFLRRADERTMSNWMQVRYDNPSKFFRSFRYNLNEWAGWNHDGDILQNGGNVNAHATFHNNWSTGYGYNLNGRTIDDRATRGGPVVYQNPRLGGWGYLQSDERPALSAGYFFFAMGDGKGSKVREISPYINYRPSSYLTINTGIGLNWNTDDSQWIEESGGHYVFGHLQQRTVSLNTRVNYTITPALTIQLYAEPFVSAGAYSRFKELVDGRAPAYDARYAPYAYGGNPDFNYRSFRTTNVLRWEYKPGSTLFVVWQQGREDTLSHGTFNFSRDFGGVFDAPARNVFLVKLAYWINP
jgi:Domain of unknown function (DUF5916)/Carbohydrate family 9 binding domain-like